MPPSAVKFVGPAVVLALVAYWLWPYLAPSVPRAAKKQAAAPLEFTTAMLRPTFPPPPKRDPFDALIAAKVAKPPSGKTGVAIAAKKDAKAKSAKAKSAKAKSAKAKSANVAQTDRKATGLVLNATCVAGEQRLAVINGRMYKQKDTVGASDAYGRRYVIAEILPDKVLLDRHGQSVAIGYLDGTVGSGGATHSIAKEGESGNGRSKKSSKSSESKSTAKAKE